MFGRSNWAILGVDPATVNIFLASIADSGTMLAASQLWAANVAGRIKIDTVGINPFGSPRLDDKFPLQGREHADLEAYVHNWPTDLDFSDLPPAPNDDLRELPGYGYGFHEYDLNPSDGGKYFGLWAVTNVWKDIADIASMREQVAYNDFNRPYTFLSSEDKQGVDAECNSTPIRKQIPVLIDWPAGRIYIRSTSKNVIESIQNKLYSIGVEATAVGWKYPDNGHWQSEILNRLFANSAFKAEFAARASEAAAKVTEDEYTVIEDAEVRRIVENDFSSTEIESGQWVGITSPAQIRLAANDDFVVVKTPTNATSLLELLSNAKLYSASITVQERGTAVNKKGDERTYRKDLFTLDLGDGINLTEIGAAMLRGFDAPNFNKTLRKRANKEELPIAHYWFEWLQSMALGVRTFEAVFNNVLGVTGATVTGIQAFAQPEIEEIERDRQYDAVKTIFFPESTPWETAQLTESFTDDDGYDVASFDPVEEPELAAAQV